MKLFIATTLAMACSAQLLTSNVGRARFGGYPIGRAAPIYNPYARAPVARAPIFGAAPLARPAVAPVTVAAPIPAPAPEEADPPPSIQDDFHDWQSTYADQLFADDYADAYNLYSTYVYNTPKSPGKEKARGELATINFITAYDYSEDNLRQQLARARASGADTQSLEYQLASASANKWSGIANWRGHAKADMLVAAGYGLALNDAVLSVSQDPHDEDAQGGFRSAQAWYLSSAGNMLGKNWADDGYIYATSIDANNAEGGLQAAQEAYYKEPSADNALALQMAEMDYDSAYAGQLAALIPNKKNGNLAKALLMKQYALAADVANIQMEQATQQFQTTHGISPFAYHGGYFP